MGEKEEEREGREGAEARVMERGKEGNEMST